MSAAYTVTRVEWLERKLDQLAARLEAAEQAARVGLQQAQKFWSSTGPGAGAGDGAGILTAVLTSTLTTGTRAAPVNALATIDDFTGSAYTDSGAAAITVWNRHKLCADLVAGTPIDVFRREGAWHLAVAGANP